MIAAIRKSCDVDEPIYYCLVASPSIQGCSFLLSGETRCIAIWMGALIIGQGLLNRLMVMPTPAKRYGLTPRPEAAIRTHEGVDTFQAFQALREPNAFGAASEHERHIVSNLTSKFGAFLVAHEVAHALNGHLFMPSTRGGRSIMELEDAVDWSDKEQWTAHAMEWDADMFAGVRLLGGSLRTSQAVEQYYRFETMEQRLRFRLINVMVAIYIACRLFQKRKFDFATVMSERHPPGSIRLLMLMTQAYSAWQQLDIEDRGPFPGHVLLDVIDMCEQAISELTGIEEVNFHLLNALPPEWVDGYQAGLFKHWRKLHPELMKWKIGSHEMIPPGEAGVLPLEELFGRRK
jgi:hypothetical protein